MLELIHLYMLCSVTVEMTMCDKFVGTMEVPTQDVAIEALEKSGHWMFTK